MRTVEEHLADILAVTPLLPAENVEIGAAQGCVLAADVLAAVDIPVFDNSAMDGFAVRFADVETASSASPVTLEVVADLPAGSRLDPPLAGGQAARIMTGAPVPGDADAIVPFEETAGGLADSLDTVTVTQAPASAGRHIRRRGEDLRAGDLVLPAGTLLGALALGAIAAAGCGEVAIRRRPQVAVISTGSELVPPGSPLRRGQIPESNSTLLAALVIEADADSVFVSSIADDDDPHRVIGHAREWGAEVIVFSGGVSAGAYEVVKNALGAQMTFSKVAMQPGKPQGFGRTEDGILLFGLPGNPVSAAVSFEVFVRPALQAMQGRSAARRMLRLPAASGWRTPPGRRQYLPVVIDRTDPAAWRAVPATGGGSHLAGGLGRAEAYAVVPAEIPAVAGGDLVDVMLVS